MGCMGCCVVLKRSAYNPGFADPDAQVYLLICIGYARNGTEQVRAVDGGNSRR
jgi:hypothetical protein